MLRHEGAAAPGAVRVLRVWGVSMEPELAEGDRLVVKRVEHVPGDGDAPAVRLKSANPDYADYTCLADDIHIVGKVLWTVRKVGGSRHPTLARREPGKGSMRGKFKRAAWNDDFILNTIRAAACIPRASALGIALR